MSEQTQQELETRAQRLSQRVSALVGEQIEGKGIPVIATISGFRMPFIFADETDTGLAVLIKLNACDEPHIVPIDSYDVVVGLVKDLTPAGQDYHRECTRFGDSVSQ